ncbi:hypothetical protein VTI74DRAFT_10431 [Chaetomium olivicolor]
MITSDVKNLHKPVHYIDDGFQELYAIFQHAVLQVTALRYVRGSRTHRHLFWLERECRTMDRLQHLPCGTQLPAVQQLAGGYEKLHYLNPGPEMPIAEPADVEYADEPGNSHHWELLQTVACGILSPRVDRCPPETRRQRVSGGAGIVVRGAKRALSFMADEINNGAKLLVAGTPGNPDMLVDIVWCIEREFQAVAANSDDRPDKT